MQLRACKSNPKTAADKTQERAAVFPTRQQLQIQKGALKGAKTGHDLLKRKSEALTKYDIRKTLSSYAIAGC